MEEEKQEKAKEEEEEAEQAKAEDEEAEESQAEDVEEPSNEESDEAYVESVQNDSVQIPKSAKSKTISKPKTPKKVVAAKGTKSNSPSKKS